MFCFKYSCTSRYTSHSTPFINGNNPEIVDSDTSNISEQYKFNQSYRTQIYILSISVNNSQLIIISIILCL